MLLVLLFLLSDICLSTMKDAVIILGGAFNPVHTQHIALLCSAKEELEKTGDWRVIGGYLAVATNGYVLHKLNSRNERTIQIEHRLALVREAMKTIPWLINSPFQEEMLKQHDGSALALGQRLKRLVRNNDLQILILIGGDRTVKKGIPIWRRSNSNQQSSVIRLCVGRIGDENIDLFRLWQDDLNQNLIPNPQEFLLINIPLQSVSSSIIRPYLTQWFNQPERRADIENDLVHTHAFLDMNVMDYIKNHANDFYINT